LDEKIKEFPIIDESDIKDVLPEAVEHKSKVKRSFFKKRKLVDSDSIDLDKKDTVVKSDR